MVRSVEDASILMGTISDMNMRGCDLDIATCLGDQVKQLREGVTKPYFPKACPTHSNFCLNFPLTSFKKILIWSPRPIRVPIECHKQW